MISTHTHRQTRTPLQRTLLSAAGAFAVILLVVGTLIVSFHLQLKRSDPLNNPQLVELRDEYAGNVGNAELQTKLRELDQVMRSEYFGTKARIRTGSALLLTAAILMFTCLGVASALAKHHPRPTATCPGITLQAATQTRAWIGGILFILICIVVVLFLSSRLQTADPAQPFESQPVATP